MKACRVIFAGTVMMVASLPAHAASSLMPTKELMDAAVDEKKLLTREGRDALVVATLAYCKQVEKAYPRNSPSEEGWLDGEIAAGSDRAVRAMSSAEFGRRSAKWFVEGCASWGSHYFDSAEKARSLAGLGFTFLQFKSRGGLDLAVRNGLGNDDGVKLFFSTVAESLVGAAVMVDNPSR